MKLFNLLFIIIFSFSAIFSYRLIRQNIGYKYKEPNIVEMVKSKTQNGYLDKKIQTLIENKKFSEVKAYVKLANKFHIEISPKTKELIIQNFTTTKKIKRGFKNFIKGFISGKAKSGTGVAGAITSDFTLYGDLRDIHNEGEKYIHNQPYDKMILGLSMAGLALSASQFVTLGASSSLKAGTSALKIAKREKALTKSFSKVLNNTLEKSIDFKALKRVKIGSISDIKSSAKIIKNSISLKPIKPILKDLRTINKSTSLPDTVKLLEYVDNQKELKAIAKLSKKYRGATVGIFKMFGKNSFRLIKAGIKWSKNLVLSTLALGLSLFGFLVSLFKLLRKLKSV